MKSLARFVCLLTWIAAASPLEAQEQISWIADVQTASAMAAEQRRLVLLHFYSDNCEPCVRLEQNVFNQPEVAHAIAQNYLAVKVHAGKNPQLAARYRVNRWPTDVFVTPSGLEVERTISPQRPGEYIAVLNRVAHQSGIAASRQWQSPLDQAVRPVGAEAAVEAGRTSPAVNGLAGQFQQTIAQGQQSAQQFNQQATDLSQRGIATANQWGQDALGAAQRYGQQANQVQQQAQQQVAQTRDQVQQNFAATSQDVSSSARQTFEQFGQAAQTASQQASAAAAGWNQQLQQTVAAAGFDRRSAFVAGDAPPAPPTAPPATSPPATSQPQAGPAQTPASVPPVLPAATAAVTAATMQAGLPALNPWVNGPRVDTAPPAASTAPPLVTAPAISPPPATSPAVSPPATPASAVASVPAPAAAVKPAQQFIPASQAPPIGLDGFCPVTLLETVAQNPNDRTAWRKGDKRFGAIHRGRTYLFVSADCQQRFLANPDGFAPALAGCDPVRFADRGEMIDGKRAYGLVTPDRRIFLFADEASRNRFEQAPANYSAAIQQAMARSEGGIYR